MYYASILNIITHNSYRINTYYVYERFNMIKKRSLSIRINDDLRKKLHVISTYEGRSANAQILYLIRKSVESYENKFGIIELSDKS